MDTNTEGSSTDADIKQLLLGHNYEHPFRWESVWDTDINNDLKENLDIQNLDDDAAKEAHDAVIYMVDYLFSSYIVDTEFPFEYLMLYIIKSYEYGMMNQYDDGLNSLQVLESELKDLSKDFSGDACYLAFFHITMSTKTFLLALSKDVDTASETIPSIPKIIEMNTNGKAALIGLQGLFYQTYGLTGFKIASNLFSEAIETNPDEAIWHFFKGKYLSRLRHMERREHLPSPEEKYHLEMALNKKKSGMFVLYAAQLYRETAKRMFQRFTNRNNWNPSGSLDDFGSSCVEEAGQLNEKAIKLYKECLELKPECPETLFRCAKGFVLFPKPLRDENLAKELLDKGLELAPNSLYGNHTMAQYYEKVGNLQKAIEHLKICEKGKLLVAVMDMIRLEHRLDRTVDIACRLRALLPEYGSTLSICTILSQLISCHLFVYPDLLKSCGYARKVRSLNGNYEHLMCHVPMCLSSYRPITINLNEILMDEVKLAIDNPALSEEENDYLKKFLKDICSSTGKQASFMDEAPQCLKRKIMQKSRGFHFQPKKFERKNQTFAFNYCTDRSRGSTATDAPALSWRKNSKGPKTAIRNPVSEKTNEDSR